ncbi:MAG: MMPL family transporter, partial [Planctomycetes bacterium]|nr:MMPL family transporter [Planctomycetota bacterium]
MKARSKIVEFSVDHPRLITAAMVVSCLVLIAVAAAPSLWPDAAAMLYPVRVDTDPENMLPHTEPVRVFHDRMKKELALYDMVVVGVVNDAHPEGVFNPSSLAKIYALTDYAKTLRWPDPKDLSRQEGVVPADLIAPSTVDNIEQGGLGSVKFEWLMARPPASDAEALAIRDKARRIPFFDGTLVSEDGKAVALYLPLTRKDLAHRVATALEAKVAELGGPERFHITGLPVAEDTFGVEMFKQMAISAPLAMLVIFILMFVFFRKVLLIVQPLILAMASVIWTMGLLIATGQTIHIMSSMIPIFIMPIAVLDAIHILSEFFDRYQETRDRRRTILRVMDTLFMPMLYTSLTTAAGFASLALTPIPPVQTFGLFVALGVMVAWGLTITFLPASIQFIPQRYLENFGLVKGHEEEHSRAPMSRLLRWAGRGTYRWAKPILALTVVAAVVAGYGISRIRINDNPTKWFEASHPIREADRVLNAHFGGTYMAYLALADDADPAASPAFVKDLAARLTARGKELAADYPAAPQAFEHLAAEAVRPEPAEGPVDGARAPGREALLGRLADLAETRLRAAEGDEADAWDQAALFMGAERQKGQVFKQPEVLRYIARLQQHLLTIGAVGKSNSLTDIVRTVYRELMEGRAENFRVPDSANAVAQCLMQYQSSHRPQDLDHFVTPDYKRTSLWVQLKSGDNRDMQQVVDSVEAYVAANPPPVALRHDWFGLTYINVIWQDRMVVGMLQSFMGSFLVVLLMMTVLYRSALWGLLAMIPLTVTIAVIYGAVGLLGVDYDMPIAVLSALTLGMAVDYAIHFLSRSREMREASGGTWQESVPAVFGEPARAITRNAIVIGVGFLPLLAAPLVPYQTVGVFMAAILLLAGVVSLIILPALMRLLEPLLFPKTRPCCLACN